MGTEFGSRSVKESEDSRCGWKDSVKMEFGVKVWVCEGVGV